MKELRAFDIADCLDSEEVIAEYSNAALEDPNPEVFLSAVADVAKAKGMTRCRWTRDLDGRASTRHCRPEQSRGTTPC